MEAMTSPAKPINLVNLENVSKSYGVKPLLSNVSLGVQAGDRIGVVGLNGGGKTTLLEVLSGIEPADQGRVSRAGDLRQAVVTQRDELVGVTVFDVVIAPLGVAEHEWAGDARIRSILDGLGVAALGLDRRVDQLSGGQRRRVGLAAALVRDLDLLILDEPTNHLDVEGVQWLAEHLLARSAGRSGVTRGSGSTALVVVTHDRWFLDTVATRTWEVVDGNVESYEGGYADWTFARAERGRQADAAEARRRNLARKELAWLRRGPPARTSKPRYRIEAAEALIADVPPPRDSVALIAFARRRLGRIVIELEDATVATPAGDELVRDLTWRLAPVSASAWWGSTDPGRPPCCVCLRVRCRWPPGIAKRAKRSASAGYARNWTTCRRTSGCSMRLNPSPCESPWETRSSLLLRSPRCSGSAPRASAPRSETSPVANVAGCS
ncbi:ABC transporter family protein [Mycobacteroides abscessus MAB_082312_2258]|nr:ABC transporter family protein [Mycobacteroides abscessus MAB_082312_2258]